MVVGRAPLRRARNPERLMQHKRPQTAWNPCHVDEDHYQVQLKNVKAMLFDYDVLTGHVERSDSVYDLTGYTLEESEPRREWWNRLIHPDDYERMMAAYGRHLDNTDQAVGLHTDEYRLIHRSGRVVYVWSQAMLLRDDTGRIKRIIGSVTDISARKLAEQAERDRRQFAEAMALCALILNSSLDLGQVLNFILDTMASVIPHDTANVMLLHGERLTLAGHRGYRENGQGWVIDLLRTKDVMLENNTEAQRMIAMRSPLVIPYLDVQQVVQTPVDGWELRSYLGMPIIFGDEVLGFLNLNSLTPHFFTEEHSMRIQVFAAQAACAIHNAQTAERMRELAAIQERQRIARDLHDSISQLLFSASLISEGMLLKARSQQQAEPMQEQLWRLNRAALAEMRRLVVEMRDTEATQFNLPEMVVHMANAAMGHSPIQVQVKIEGSAALPTSVSTELYRIAQEALNNVIKHANASDALITLQLSPESVVLRVQDYGKGFDPASIEWSSTGLSNIRARAREIGAQYTLESIPGSGTTIEVRWQPAPIPQDGSRPHDSSAAPQA
ncbi:MAG: PAS domain-containing protein [bacterium]|nr:PAS domain-containing protein [bacterium]